MTRKVVDASDYQAGLALDTVAANTDGAWFKAGDWAYISQHGWPADDIHDAAISRFTQLGKPVGSYFFVRPGSTVPSTQIEGWAAHAPKGLSMRPMIDLEKTAITGNSLRDWIEEAIVLTTQAFGVAPALYWSNAFAQANGMSAPSGEHLPMVAEYHRGYTPFLWANRDSWESYAYSAFGGPDVPPGYGAGVTPRSLIWQCTSSAQIPGFAGLVDLDLVPDAAWAQLTSAAVPTDPILELLAMPTNQDTLNALAEFVRLFGPGGPYFLADVWNRSAADHTTIEGADLNALPLVRNVFNGVNGDPSAPDNYLSLTLGAIQASVDKVAAGGGTVDVKELAALISSELAGTVNVDPDAMAERVAQLFATRLGSGGTPNAPLAAMAEEDLPDPSANARAAVALASLSHAVFDPDTGVRGEVARELEKMQRTADGHAPTTDQIADAVEGKLADAARRAGLKAQESEGRPATGGTTSGESS